MTIYTLVLDVPQEVSQPFVSSRVQQHQCSLQEPKLHTRLELHVPLRERIYHFQSSNVSTMYYSWILGIVVHARLCEKECGNDLSQ